MYKKSPQFVTITPSLQNSFSLYISSRHFVISEISVKANAFFSVRTRLVRGEHARTATTSTEFLGLNPPLGLNLPLVNANIRSHNYSAARAAVSEENRRYLRGINFNGRYTLYNAPIELILGEPKLLVVCSKKEKMYRKYTIFLCEKFDF